MLNEENMVLALAKHAKQKDVVRAYNTTWVVYGYCKLIDRHKKTMDISPDYELVIIGRILK